MASRSHTNNEFLIRRAKKLHSDGLSFNEIGRSLGITGKTASRWVRS